MTFLLIRYLGAAVLFEIVPSKGNYTRYRHLGGSNR